MIYQYNDPFVNGMSYVSHGQVCFFKGMFPEAQDSLLKGVAFCEKTGLVSYQTYGSFFVGRLYLETSEYEKAQGWLSKCIATMEKMKFLSSLSSVAKLYLTEAKVLNNNDDFNLSDIFECYKSIKLKLYQAGVARAIGSILINLDDRHASEAEAWIARGIEDDKRNGLKWELARDYAALAKLFERKGDAAKAEKSLLKAIDIFKECGADGWIQKYEGELASLA